MKNLKKHIYFIVATVLVLLCSSCEVGLGAEVDTDAPLVAITYPPESSVIKGSFILAGTCSDDMEVASVTVTLKNTNTNEVLGTYNAKIEGETWSLELNKEGSYNGFEYPDGRYSVDVTAKDTSERVSGVSSSSFDIDNTAPVLILSKPLAIGSEAASGFGQTIKIAGDISEEHLTNYLHMKVHQWDPDTKNFIGEEKEISVSDFSTMSSDNPLVIAKYYTNQQIANAEESTRQSMVDLRNKYLQIYGSILETSEGFKSDDNQPCKDKTFYATVLLKDNAKEYKNPGDSGVDSGNISESYYINNTDFYNNLMSENAYSLNATKLRKILNKTSKEYSDDQKTRIMELLPSYTVSSTNLSTVTSKFSVNPNNNPVYIINEYEQGFSNSEPVNKNIKSEEEKSSGYRTLFKGSSINLTIEAGNDGFVIDPKTVSVKVYKMESYGDTNFADKTVENGKVWEILHTGDWNISSSTNLGTTLLIDNTTIGSVNGAPAPYSDTFFEGGEFYRVIVDGQDIEGGSLAPKCNTGYGFLINSNTNPPTISITTAADQYFSGTKVTNDGIEIDFTVTTGGETVSPTVTLTKSGTDLRNYISVLKESGGSSGVKITNTSTNAVSNLSVNVIYPNEVPTYVREADGRYSYNLKLVIGKDSNKTSNSVPSESGKYKYSFVLKVADSVLKTSTIPFTFYVDNDSPKISEEKISPVETGNLVNGIINITANASDNYELAEVSYNIYVDNSETPVQSGSTAADPTTFGSLTSPSATFDTSNYGLPENGKAKPQNIKIEITAKDSVGNTYPKTIDNYKIDQTSDRPIISAQNFNPEMEQANVSSTNGNVFDKNSKIIGSVSDTDGLASVSYKIKNASGTVVKSTTPLSNVSGTLFSIQVPEDHGYYEVIITAKDSTYDAGNANTKPLRIIEKSFWIAVDNAVPTFTLASVDDSTDNIFSTQYKSGDVIYKGTVKDDWELEGVYAYINNNNTTEGTVTIDKENPNDDGTFNWTYKLPLSSKNEGEYSLKLIAKDKAGKTKEITSSIVKDEQPPKFFTKSDYLTEAGTIPISVITKGTNGWYKETSVDIEGYVADSTSNIKSVEYTIDGTNYSPLNISYGKQTVDNVEVEDKKKVHFTGTVFGLTNGKVITVKVTDVAGNDCSGKTNIVKIDSIAPSVKLEGYKVDGVIYKVNGVNSEYEEKIDTIYINGTKNLTLKGTISDDVSGVDVLYFNPKTQVTSKTNPATIVDGNWTRELSTDVLEGFGPESIASSIYVKAVDKAGNEISIPLVSVVYDINYPVASISKVKYKGTDKAIDEANGWVTFEGTASDNQILSKVYLQYSTDKSNWTNIGTEEIVNVNNWSIDVNTKILGGDGDYYFRAVGVDSVGNIGNTGKSIKITNGNYETEESKLKKITVNQDSDKPVIKLTNVIFNDDLETTQWLLDTNDLFVSVSDDDGVEKIEYSENGTTYYETTNKINLTDGAHTIYFRITDKALPENGVYETSKTLTPKLQDKDGNAYTDSYLNINIDKTAPEMNTLRYSLGTEVNKTNTNSLKFGGKNNELKVTLNAKDANYIKDVKIEEKKSKHTWNGSTTIANENVENPNDHSWTIIVKDTASDTFLKNLPSDTYEFKIVITDGAGKTNERLFNLTIDNTPATLVVDSHIMNEVVGQNFILKGIVNDSDLSTKVKYIINSSSTAPTDWTSAKPFAKDATVASWRFYVDGADASDTETHVASLKDLFITAYSTIVEKNADNKVVEIGTNTLYTTLQPLYFHFLTEDQVGNEKVTTFSLMVDPQGDLPSVRMTYPVATNTTDNSVTLSGLIRATGDASYIGDDNGIAGIYMQIDPKYNGSFTNKWKKTASNTPANTIVSPSKKAEGTTNPLKLSDVYKSENVTLFENIYTRYNNQIGLAADKKKTENISTGTYNEYGIYVGNKTSWNITLNKNGELNGVEATNDKGEKYITINRIAIKLIVVDNAGNKTETTPLLVDVDSDAPIFGTQDFYVYQYAWIEKSTGRIYYSNCEEPAANAQLYSDSGCRTVASGKTYRATDYTNAFLSQPYTDDMSLKGEWWLSGSVEDESDIYKIEEEKSGTQIVLKDNGNQNGTYTSGTLESNVSRFHNTENNNNGFIFNYRVGSTEVNAYGKRSYQIKATEYNEEANLRKSSEKIFSINFDNKAPVVETSGSYFKMESIVTNNNGFYTVGTRAKEEGEQSGFARAVFFFTKANNAKVYDTYIKKGETGNEVTNSTNFNGLYWKTGTASNISASTVTLAAADANVHKGGLVYFGGAYYTITAKSGNDITLDKAPSETLKGTPIYFAIGHVVDNTKTEAKGTQLISDKNEGYGYYSDGDTIDDFMYETVSTGVGTTVWSGTVNSNNIADGAAVLHYVVFDNAGNYSENTLNVIIGNNAPRLASVEVSCDYNGNGNYTDREIKHYYYAERQRTIDGKTVSRASDVTKNLIVNGGDSDTAYMSIKDKVRFTPEIVGGNGNLYYSQRIGSGSISYVATSLGTGFEDGNLYEPKATTQTDKPYLTYDSKDYSYINGHNDYSIEIPYDSFSSLSGNQDFEFTIYDSAEGCTAWNTSGTGITGRLSASLKVKLNVLQDTQAPKTNVKRFFYQNKNNNSLYKNSAENGHIELEDYLTNKIVETSVNGTTLGNDPKVSGIITIRGTAFDDIRLSTLSVQFPGHEKIVSSDAAATYTNGVWTSVSEDNDTNMSTNGWTFTVTDRYNDERGHFVDWECNIDTSFITGIAVLDRIFTIKAKDARGNGSGRESSTASGQATANDSSYDVTKEADVLNRPTYKMDVVPYIRRLHTSLSSANSANPSVYDRTSSGHYPVYVTYSVAAFSEGEKIQLVGFNLAKGNSNVDYYIHTDTSGTKTDTFSTGPFPEYKVNGIPILNNINNNEAKGYDLNSDGSKKTVTLSESNYSMYAYNRQANDTNNNLLTDDLYLDVWQINNKAADPGNNYALDMTMGINQQTGLIGFAYEQGKNFIMPRGNTSASSYTIYSGNTDLIRCASFTYDSLGNSYGAVLPADEDDPYQLVSSRWTNGQHQTIGQNSSGIQDKDRYQSTSYATVASADGTTLYKVFFDNIKGTIRLSSGTIEGDGSSNVSATGNFESSNTDSDAISLLIANKTGTGCLGKSGEYVSVAITTDNHVVLVWYNNADTVKKLMYAYYNDTGVPTTNTTIKPASGNAYWTVVDTLLPNGGKYCKVVADNNGGVHIAAYDVLNADLKYFYLSAYNATDNPKKATVDSYLTIGQNITLDVAADSDGNQIPYIGYWGTYPKRPRYAYLKTPSAADWDGVKNNKYTGVWECTLVPSASEVYIDENTPWRVNVGVWKNKDSIKTNGAGVLVSSGTHTTTATACYGNGTSNAVLSYLRTNPANAATNFVETAQLK